MNNETFIYMGGDMVVPRDVVRVRVHPSVTVIPEEAFLFRSKLEEIELGEGLLEIGSHAFNYCSSLKRIIIPTFLKTIGSHAFEHCEKLEEVILCEGLLEVGSYAFNGCEALKRISIPSTVTILNDFSIASCTKLQDVELNEGMLEIRQYAFYHCHSLKSIKVPPTVSMIGKWAFAYCEKLEYAALCEGLLEIGEFIFLCCSVLKQITIPSTVTMISKGAFKKCGKLEKVELNAGLVEIGVAAFYDCYWLESINFPSTLKTIRNFAFCQAFLNHLTLPDGIEIIEDHAFWNGEFTTVRIPPLITTITEGMCYCIGMLSMEIPTSIEKIDDEAFKSNWMLRNIVLPSNAKIGNDAFKDCDDLKQLGTERNIIKALKHRFDRLPIHKMLYYQSYDQGEDISSKLHDPSFKQQDTLGMTPLHILACSTKQNIELYKKFIERHPGSLITKDKWGAVPLLYAIWSKANSDIVELLVQSYKSIFPNYEFNWTTMMETLGIFSATGTETKRLHNIQRESFPDQFIDLDTLVENAITRSNPDNTNYMTLRSLACFTTRIISTRALKIRYRPIRLQIMESIRTKDTPDTIQGRRYYVNNVYKNLEIIEDKYNRMMEALTMFELLLWKNKMDDCCRHQRKTRQTKKTRMDDSAMRKQCRIRCGAETNIVIEHVLPYLDYFST